jgi:arsenite-transporting ATPase
VSIDLFEKAAVGNNEARRVMDGDPVLAQLQERKSFFEFAGRTLREDAAFFLVLNPDELSVNETERAINQLADKGLAVRGLVANKLTPTPDPDENGRGARYLRDRIETETERLDRVREEFEPPLVAEIETRVSEIKGDFLAEVASEVDIETAVETPTQTQN